MQTFNGTHFQPSSHSPLAGMVDQRKLHPVGTGYTTTVPGGNISPHSNYSRPIKQSNAQQQLPSMWGTSNGIPSGMAAAGLTSGGPIQNYYTGSSIPYASTTVPQSTNRNYTPFATTISPRNSVIVAGPNAHQQPFRQTSAPSGYGLPAAGAPGNYISPSASFVGSNVKPTNVTSQFTPGRPNTVINALNPGLNQWPQYSRPQTTTGLPTASYLTAPNSTTSYITAPHLPTTSVAHPVSGAPYYQAPIRQLSFPTNTYAPQQHHLDNLSMMEDRVLNRANKFGVVEFPPKLYTHRRSPSLHSLPRNAVGCFN